MNEELQELYPHNFERFTLPVLNITRTQSVKYLRHHCVKELHAIVILRLDEEDTHHDIEAFLWMEGIACGLQFMQQFLYCLPFFTFCNKLQSMNVICQLFDQSGKSFLQDFTLIFVTIMKDSTFFEYIQARLPDMFQHGYVIAFLLTYRVNPTVTFRVERTKYIVRKEKACYRICTVYIIDKEGTHVIKANGKLASFNTDLLN